MADRGDVAVMSVEGMYQAAAQLAKSSKGRHALKKVLAWLDGGGLSLDALNQEAILTLLSGAWGPFAGTARDAMREALAPKRDTANAGVCRDE